jgi:hypothetical protein
MATFPTKESEIVALAETMIAGYGAHAADFPSVTAAMRTALQTTLDTYQSDKQLQTNALAQAKLATTTKEDKLDSLIDAMKNDLKLSEVDTMAVPEKLAEIGWSPKAPPQPTTLPGQPEILAPASEGHGAIWLEWNRPSSGGAVRNYVIERRQQPTGGGEFGPWVIAGSSLNTDLKLTDQPRGIQLEYRIKAANIAGESIPSNTVDAVL